MPGDGHSTKRPTIHRPPTIPPTKHHQPTTTTNHHHHKPIAATSKRPVPLEHCVYHAGELYPVMRGDAFLGEGVRKAAAAAKRKAEGGGGGGGGSAAAQRPTGRGDRGGPNSGGGRGGGGGGGRGGGGGGGYGQRGGSADNARRQVQALSRGAAGGGPNSGGRGGGAGERAQLAELVQLLRKRDLLPAAVFCFSKRRCDAAADALGGLDLTTAAEKHASHVFVERCLARLAEGDRALPQVRFSVCCCVCVHVCQKGGVGVASV